jgi:hypothetical protein
MPKINDWKLSPYIVILYYKRYSCGKFLSNILSFNKNFVAQIPLTLKVKRYNDRIEAIQHPNYDSILNDYKMEQIFLTIPPDREECKNWMEYELGCSMFWNFNETNFNVDDVHLNCLRLLDDQKYCFIAAHTFDGYQKIKNVFKNAKTIELVNDDLIQTASLDLKRPTGVYVSTYSNQSILESIKFNIGSMFEKQIFFQNIFELLEYFNLEDSRLDDRVYDYYEKYINLYHAKAE